MDSIQLTQKLRSDPICNPQFAGVYASDELPQSVDRKPRLFIVNTDVSRGFGIHWVALYFPIDEPAEFFNSIGHPPDSHFHRFLQNNGPTYMFQKRRLQGFGSRTCGQFCLFYALHRCRGWTLEKIVDFFKGQKEWQNDETIRHFFSSYSI
jgi:hypothetical protein